MNLHVWCVTRDGVEHWVEVDVSEWPFFLVTLMHAEYGPHGMHRAMVVDTPDAAGVERSARMFAASLGHLPSVMP